MGALHGHRLGDLAERGRIWWAQHFCVQPMRSYRRRLVDYVFTDPTPDERADLERHLDECYRCSAVVTELRLVRRRFRMLARAYRALLDKGMAPGDASARSLLAQAYWHERRRSRQEFELGLDRQDRVVEACLGLRLRDRTPPAAGHSWTRRLASPSAAAIAVAAVVLTGAALVRFGGWWTERAPTASNPPSEAILLETGEAVAAQLILQEPMIDLRTSYGPAQPGVAMILRQGLAEPVTRTDAGRVEAELALKMAAGSSNPRVAMAAAVISAFRKKLPEARDMMERAVAVAAPDDALIFLDAGVVAFLLSDFEKAGAYFTLALDADPQLVEAQYDLARLFEVTGLVENAQEAWERYATMDSVSMWADLAKTRSIETIDRTNGAQNRLDRWPPWQ